MEEKISEYIVLPDQLEAAVAGLSDEQLDIVPQEGKWSVRQLVHHIVDADDMVKNIIRAAIGHNGCQYDQTWYDTDNSMAAPMAYDKRPIGPLLKLFRANKEYAGELIRTIPAAWESYVMFVWKKSPEGRKLTVGYLVQSQTRHIKHHIEQILAIRQSFGTGS